MVEPLDTVNKIERRYRCRKKTPWCILRFDNKTMYSRQDSWFTPKEFLKVSEKLINGYGFVELGGLTEAGTGRLVKVVKHIEDWVNCISSEVNFTNLYHEYFFINEVKAKKRLNICLYGLLAIFCCGYAYITCTEDPRGGHSDTSPSKEIIELAKKFKLSLRGGTRHQILYMPCRTMPPLRCLDTFLRKLVEYLQGFCNRFTVRCY